MHLQFPQSPSFLEKFSHQPNRVGVESRWKQGNWTVNWAHHSSFNKWSLDLLFLGLCVFVHRVTGLWSQILWQLGEANGTEDSTKLMEVLRKSEKLIYAGFRTNWRKGSSSVQLHYPKNTAHLARAFKNFYINPHGIFARLFYISAMCSMANLKELKEKPQCVHIQPPSYTIMLAIPIPFPTLDI